MMQLFEETCLGCSRLITNNYSTSFSLGIKALAKKFHDPIYGVYGFVRFADEIVDTFHDYDKQKLLEEFKVDTYKAIEQKISLNPVLQSFQQVVHEYDIPIELIDAFLYSMALDLEDQNYDPSLYDVYIYGSAEVVGLMCLKVFCEGDKAEYERLVPYARKLGSAFQKVNFLRDMKSDYVDRGRVYFPGVSFNQFDDEAKKVIEADIEADFTEGYKGIVQLPEGAKFGVYTAYRYYLKLFDKIRHAPVERVLNERIRVPNQQKMTVLFKSFVRNGLNLL